jgi:predicted AlkP superfamily pyrophosphatase or phosphodiesterase
MSTARGGRLAALAVALVLSLFLPFVAGTTTFPSADGALLAEEAAAVSPGPQRAVNGKRVVAISLDGLNPRALTRLGRARTPYLHRMLANGAGTLNARTQVEQTVTLPNHTSMVTGDRIDAAHGGHGVTWNEHLAGTTVQGAAGAPVSSVFSVVKAGGGSTAVFATKEKFTLFDRSWPADVDRSVVREEDDTAATRAMRRDFVTHRRAFVLLHLGLADHVGHSRGWMSPAYLRAVVRLDELVGSVMRMVRDRPGLRRSTVVVLTADHGGVPGTRRHGDPRNYENYRVPFVIWGRGVADASLYSLNPFRLRPGRTRPGFTGRQPIRNADLANLATDILGLGPVDGSLWNHDQRLTWR